MRYGRLALWFGYKGLGIDGVLGDDIWLALGSPGTVEDLNDGNWKTLYACIGRGSLFLN